MARTFCLNAKLRDLITITEWTFKDRKTTFELLRTGKLEAVTKRTATKHVEARYLLEKGALLLPLKVVLWWSWKINLHWHFIVGFGKGMGNFGSVVLETDFSKRDYGYCSTYQTLLKEIVLLEIRRDFLFISIPF